MRFALHRIRDTGLLAFDRAPGHVARMDEHVSTSIAFAAAAGALRHDWTRDDVRALFALPFPELIFRAQSVHRMHFDPAAVQISTLLSIKTGGCPEDCAYCPQSVKYETGVKADRKSVV